MTYIDALNTAIANVDTATAEKLEALRDQLARHKHNTTDEQKEAHKAKTAAARSSFVQQIMPVLRDTLSKCNMPLTAQELFDMAKPNLPEDFTRAKVQNILAREMAPELNKVKNKNKVFTYELIKTA